jgi:mRNA interferase MazF
MLVPFKFTKGDETKRRPVVIVSVADYHRHRADAVAVALTTNMDRIYFGDCIIDDWRSAGLPMPSLAKGVIATIERSQIERRLGTLTADDLSRLDRCLQQILGL